MLKMSIRTMSLTLLIITAVILGSAFAEPSSSATLRNIYVGDVLELRIETMDYTQDEIELAFQNFEILRYEEDEEVIFLDIRSLEAGSFAVDLGEQKFTIQIASTLDDMKRDSIFESDNELIANGSIINPYYILLGVGLICLLSSFTYYLTTKKKKLVTILTPMEKFNEEMAISIPEHSDFLILIGQIFKQYLEDQFVLKVCSKSIMGLTTDETIEILKSIPILNDSLDSVREWLVRNDYSKFSGKDLTLDQKKEEREQVIILVQGLEKLVKSQQMGQENHLIQMDTEGEGS